MQGPETGEAEPAVAEGDQIGALRAAGEDIKRYKTKQIEYFLKVASIVADLKDAFPSLTPANLTSWLQREFQFSLSEAQAFANASKDLARSAKLLENARISPDTIRALIASDAQTRSACLLQIGRGDRVDESVVERIRSALAAASMSPENLERQSRFEAFSRASSDVGAAAVGKLEREASELLSLLDDAAAELAAGASKEEVLSSRREMLRKRAASLLQSLENLFGSSHAPRHRETAIVSQGTAAASITYSWYALRDLDEGMIEARDISASDDGWKGLRSCLEFLAGRRFSAISHASSMGLPPRLDPSRKPKFVDIDAGVGGTSLGLQAAGFEAVAVYIKDADARNAVRKNRPSWDIRKFVRRDFRDELCNLAEKDVDLVTSGLPWHHYDPTHGAKAANGQALTAVELLKPRAFIFEVASPEREETTARPFEELGYDVQWHSIDISRFGIAQSKFRSVMIGARDGFLANFSIPVINPPQRRALSDVLRDHVAAHVWDGSEDGTARTLYEAAVSNWTHICSEQFPLAPELPRPHSRKRKNDWLKLGIDISRYTNKPPTPDDFKAGKGFRLTSAMLKRIQSFPDVWTVETNKSNAPQVAGSFPPVAAKMVGLALHSALTGVEFDYQRAAKSASLLAVKKIQIRKGDPLQWTPTSISWLLADVNRTFRLSAAKEHRTREA